MISNLRWHRENTILSSHNPAERRNKNYKQKGKFKSSWHYFSCNNLTPNLVILSTSRSLFFFGQYNIALTFLQRLTNKNKNKHPKPRHPHGGACPNPQDVLVETIHTLEGKRDHNDRQKRGDDFLLQATRTVDENRKGPHGGNENSVVFFAVCVMGNMYMFSKEWAIKSF